MKLEPLGTSTEEIIEECSVERRTMKKSALESSYFNLKNYKQNELIE